MSASLPGQAFGANPAAGQSLVSAVETRDELARVDAAIGSPVYLSEPGREGFFVRVAGAPPAQDPLQGLYLPCSTPGFHFARIWDGTHGHPEWFGARVNDWRFDCADAIGACIALCPVTLLGQSDYFVRRTVVIDTSWRTVRGVGTYATDERQGTRLILQGQAPRVHEDDILLIGSRQAPRRDSSSFVREIHVAQLTVVRDGTSASHASSELRRYPTGVRVGFVERCTLTSLASLESSVGFYVGGVVYTKVDDCLAQRLRAGVGSGPDLAVGFYLDGAPEIGFAGGNASLYVSRCLAVGQHAGHVRPTGLVAQGAFVDSFVDHFESARIDHGTRISAAGTSRSTQIIDLHLRFCTLDGCGGTALELDLAGQQGASVEIIDPYIYAAGGGGARGLVVRDGGGLVTVTGGQVHGDFREGSLLLQQTRGVRVQGLKIHEGSRPVILQSSGALQIEPQISNLARRTASFAITANGVYRSAIRAMVIGSPGMLAGGVSLDANCNYSSVDGSAIDPGCFGEVTSARKLWFGEHDAVTGPGNVAFTKAGNVVTGALG